MTCYRFCSGVEFVFVAIIVSNALCISMEANALEQSSNDFQELKSINFIIDLLNMHSDLIHMEIVKIDSSEPQCVVIIDSVKNLMALRDFKQQYRYPATMKAHLRYQHFLWFEFTKVSPRIDRPVIFTHELIKHQPAHLCNSAALKAPRTPNGESVCWRYNSTNFYQTRLEHVISAKNVSIINRNTGKAEPMPFDVSPSKKRKRRETSTLEPYSDAFHEVKSIHFVIDLLNLHPDLIRMEVVMIDSSEPQCVVIINSAKKLMALPELRQKYRNLAKMKDRLRDQYFSWFELTTRPSSRIDRPVIFTHELIKHQPAHLCNSAALKAPRAPNGESVRWSHNNYLHTNLGHPISAKSVSVVNRNTGKAEPFTAFPVVSGSGRQKRKLDEASSSIPDLNQLPTESDIFWSDQLPYGQ